MDLPARAEQELVERARRGDEAAFAKLVDAYSLRIFRIVRRMSPDTMEAEAIVQETFWRFWNRLPRYDAARPLLPYLVTIASNLARDRYRRERQLVAIEEDGFFGERSRPDIEEELDHADVLQALSRAVEALPFTYRAVVSLRYEGEMSYEDIAETLGLPLNTVRTHLRRAKQILRRQIEE